MGQAVVAVVKPHEEHLFAPQALMDECKAKLPNFMVPSKIEILTELPRNPNGKIDRKALSKRFATLFQA